MPLLQRLVRQDREVLDVLVLVPGADVATAVRILTDRHGPIDYTVHPEGDTDAVYYERRS